MKHKTLSGVSGKIPSAFWRGNQCIANLQVGLQRYVMPAAPRMKLQPTQTQLNTTTENGRNKLAWTIGQDQFQKVPGPLHNLPKEGQFLFFVHIKQMSYTPISELQRCCYLGNGRASCVPVSNLCEKPNKPVAEWVKSIFSSNSWICFPQISNFSF